MAVDAGDERKERKAEISKEQSEGESVRGLCREWRERERKRLRERIM